MHTTTFSRLVAAALFVPFVAVAASFPDSPRDRASDVSIDTLVALGIVAGHDDGYFRPYDPVNRAEFAKIVINTYGYYDRTAPGGCFVDVPVGAWYAPYVCRAKEIGIVTGHADPNLPPSLWRFAPADQVQYAEALAMLSRAFGYEGRGGGAWYERYINMAEDSNIALPNVYPDTPLTRAQTARLALLFKADAAGELPLLYDVINGYASVNRLVDALDGVDSSSSSSSSYPWQSSSSSSWTSSSSSSSSSSSPITNAAIRSGFLLLGSTSPVIGAIRVFPEQEPLHVTKISIVLPLDASSVDSVDLYDGDGYFLGSATLRSSTNVTNTFSLTLPVGAFTIDKQETQKVSAKVHVKSDDNGGVSGQTVQIIAFSVEGNGAWSNNAYVSSSNETYLIFETAKANITRVVNLMTGDNTLIEASNQILGKMRFDTQIADASTIPTLRTVRFQIAASNAIVSNVILTNQDGSASVQCPVSNSVATCSNVETLGSLSTAGQSLVLRGDIDITSTSNNATVRAFINEPGSPLSSGDIVWSDGDTVFDWVALDSPVMTGTSLRQ